MGTFVRPPWCGRLGVAAAVATATAVVAAVSLAPPAAATGTEVQASQAQCSTRVETTQRDWALDDHRAVLTCYGNTHSERKFVRGVLDLPGQFDVHTEWVEIPPNTTSSQPAQIRTTQKQGSMWGASPSSYVDEFRCPVIDFGDCNPNSVWGDAIIAFADLIL